MYTFNQDTVMVDWTVGSCVEFGCVSLVFLAMRCGAFDSCYWKGNCVCFKNGKNTRFVKHIQWSIRLVCGYCGLLALVINVFWPQQIYSDDVTKTVEESSLRESISFSMTILRIVRIQSLKCDSQMIN